MLYPTQNSAHAYVPTDDIVTEIHQRQERAKNIIAYNVSESNSTKPKVKINHDIEMVTNKIKYYCNINLES